MGLKGCLLCRFESEGSIRIPFVTRTTVCKGLPWIRFVDKTSSCITGEEGRRTSLEKTMSLFAYATDLVKNNCGVISRIKHHTHLWCSLESKSLDSLSFKIEVRKTCTTFEKIGVSILGHNVDQWFANYIMQRKALRFHLLGAGRGVG